MFGGFLNNIAEAATGKDLDGDGETGNKHTRAVVAKVKPTAPPAQMPEAAKQFDEAYYLAANPDIADAVRKGVIASGEAHFNAYGAQELRNPNRYFDAKYYLKVNGDVAKAVQGGQITAWAHWVSYGWAEKRVCTANPPTSSGSRAVGGESSGVFGGGFDSLVANFGTPLTGQRAADATDEAAAQLDDGHDLPLSTCDGNKKSLFIGINYFGSSAELRGCINDVVNIKEFVVNKFGFPTDPEHMRTLTDDQKDPNLQPTKANMIKAFHWLVAGAKAGDSLFFHFSGHGGYQADADPDTDEVDGQDETLIPVDYETAGQIVDDDLHAMLVADLPKGVRLTMIGDCCHSGSVLDLPYTYNIDGNLEVHEVDNRKEAMKAAMAAGMAFFKGDKATAMTHGVKAVKCFFAKPTANNSAAKARQIKVRSTLADVIQFSGCRDDQTSADASIGGEATGAMSWAFRTAFEQHGMDQHYPKLLGNIRTILQGKYSQVPQMSAGHRMNLNTSFKM